VENFSKRYTPFIVENTFKRLRTLVKEEQYEPDMIMMAFYDVNNPAFVNKYGVWN